MRDDVIKYLQYLHGKTEININTVGHEIMYFIKYGSDIQSDNDVLLMIPYIRPVHCRNTISKSQNMMADGAVSVY